MNPLFHRSRPPPGLQLPGELRARLEALFDAITIVSPTAFRLAGSEPISCAPGDSAQALAEQMVPFVYSLAYAQPWREGMPLKLSSSAMHGSSPHAPDAAFVARLSASNRGQQRRDPAWRVYQLGQGGALHVQKGESYRLAPPGEYTWFGGPGRAPGVGDTVELLVLSDSQVIQPGFYFVFGETVASEFDDAHLARLYFHTRPEHAPWLIEHISEALNHYHVPFRLKCLTAPSAFERTDPFVLYVARRFLGITLRLLAARADELRERLQPGVPLFTRELLPGLGAADEPGTGESFGQSRCRLVCHGIVDAWRQGVQTREGRLRAVAERFARLGLDLERPYLNEGMENPYEWPLARSADA